MKFRYFAGKRPLITGRLYIHREGCPFLSEASKSLGLFNTVYEAIESRKINYVQQEPCPYCCKDQLKQENVLKTVSNKKKPVQASHFDNLRIYVPGTYNN